MLILDKPPNLAFPQPSHLDLLSVDHSAPPLLAQRPVLPLAPSRPLLTAQVKSPVHAAAQVVDPIEAPAKTQTFWL